MNILPVTIKASESLQSPPMIINRAAHIMTAFSVIAIITSYVKKESTIWKTWIAVIMSFVRFVLVS